MSDLNITLRRNFIVAIAVHAALVGTLFFTERWLSDSKKPFAAPVQLVVPADILGELPKGPGHGRGAYAPPKEAVALTHGGGGAEATPPPGTVKQTSTPQLPSPNATPSKTSVTDPDDITIPKPSAKPPKTSTPKSTPTTSPAKTTTAKTGVARSASQMASASTAPSPDQFRAGLLDALRRYGGGAGIEGGTPYGDNRPAGGGTGRGRIGSPDGAPDGVPGGIGQGSPHWRYFLHVRDRLYEAWDQPGVVNDRKLTAVVVIRVARDGSITDVTLKRSSGNRLMDQSVLAAVHKARMLEPPPDALLKGAAAEIVVDFHLEG